MRVTARLWLVLLALSMFGAADLAQAQGISGIGGGSRRRRRDRDRDRRPSRYIVAQCRDEFGKITFEVIPDTEFKQRQKDCRERFEELKKDWIMGYRLAKKRKEKYDEPKPVELYVVRCRYARSSYKAEQEAQAFADKIQEAYEKKLAKKRKKDGEDFLGGDDAKQDHKVDREKKVKGKE